MRALPLAYAARASAQQQLLIRAGVRVVCLPRHWGRRTGPHRNCETTAADAAAVRKMYYHMMMLMMLMLTFGRVALDSSNVYV